MRLISWTILFLSVASSNQALSLSQMQSPITKLRNLWEQAQTETAQRLLIHPFSAHQDRRELGLRSFAEGSTSLSETSVEILRNQGVPRYLTIRPIETTGLGLRAGVNKPLSLEFEYKGIPLCHGYSVRSQELVGRQAMLIGEWPKLANSLPADQPWPSKPVAVAALSQLNSEGRLQIKDWKQCFAVVRERLSPAWKISIDLDGLPFFAEVGVDGNLDSLQPKFFSNNAVARTRHYIKNPDDGVDQYVTLGKMAGNGILQNKYFLTETNDVDRARVCSQDFAFEDSDPRFAESVAFTNASIMLDWLHENMDYERDATSLIEVRVHETFVDGDTNNAMFIPAESSSSGRDKIRLGNGDGEVLRNLPLDFDVTGHEMVHLYVYQTVTETTGESVKLHEGLADFLTFAKTGDACLAESICPADSGACFVPGSCLRTADQQLTYAVLETGGSAHVRSQVISSLLWSLRAEVGEEIILDLVKTTIANLSKTSSYTEFLTTLIASDATGYDGQHCEAIKAEIEAREMLSFIGEDFSCAGSSFRLADSGLANPSLGLQDGANENKLVLAVSASDELSQPLTNSCTGSIKSSNAALSCGTVRQSANHLAGHHPESLLLLVFPFLFVVCAKLWSLGISYLRAH